MMRVSGLDKNDDWTFGAGKSTYKLESEMVSQNLVTRLRSFKNDWFLDIDANIDWITILGNRNNREIITREIIRVALSTDGVATIDELDIVDGSNRNLEIKIKYTDVFSSTFEKLVTIA